MATKENSNGQGGTEKPKRVTKVRGLGGELVEQKDTFDWSIWPEDLDGCTADEKAKLLAIHGQKEVKTVRTNKNIKGAGSGLPQMSSPRRTRSSDGNNG